MQQMNRNLFYLEIFFKDLTQSDDRIDFNSNVEQKKKIIIIINKLKKMKNKILCKIKYSKNYGC